MDAPASFWALALRFHQDVPMFVEGTETALADYLVRGLLPAERRELAGFLDAALAMPDAGNRLLRLWKTSRAEFSFERGNDIGAFFTLVRSRL